MKQIFSFTAGLLLVTTIVSAKNPITPDIGMSDPHVRVFNDTVFLYTGKDADSISGDTLHAKEPEWDNTARQHWPESFKDIEIPSSADGKMQNAYFYKTSSSQPRPLIVSLHTWSQSYSQRDPLVQQVLTRDYNYIRPDFRGPNYTPEACGSPLVASDIDDAIAYAIQHGNVDTHNIHIIGVSGGGHATLIAYMQSKHPVRSFSAWVPITDVAKWYYESVGRGTRYAEHISKATTGTNYGMDTQEAMRRSPIHMSTPVEKRKNSKLYLYAGIHDGHRTSSVPISHSLNMYNKVVGDYDVNAVEDLIPDQIISQLLVGRYMPGEKRQKIGDRTIHYSKQYKGKVRLVIFEGRHEMLVDVALNHIPSKTVLIFGDSNGANQNGWVYQLQKRRFNHLFFNTSISGNTIGFDNRGRESRNLVKNVKRHLSAYDPQKDAIDQVFLLLGTNDCKDEFDHKLSEIPEHYRSLLDSIIQYYEGGDQPDIVMISPPPYGEDEVLKEKYHGAADRIRFLNEEFQSIANEYKVPYIDIQSVLWPIFNDISRDGVHFNKEGYALVGILLDRMLRDVGQ